MNTKRALALPLILAVLLVAVAVCALHRPLLRAAGRALVASDQPQRADVIVITIDADGAGVLEGADLMHEGIASRIAVFSDPPDEIDREFMRRGAPYYDLAAVELWQLRALGITSAEVIPRGALGTHDEADVLPQWCAAKGYHTVVLVGTTDHSRRTGRIMRRAFKGRGTKVIVVPSRYSPFNPDDWWRSRAGVRTGFEELAKLLLDILRHPIS
jgi:uncharacterized SAM-binding protein YcdF (DUF218 family)